MYTSTLKPLPACPLSKVLDGLFYRSYDEMIRKYISGDVFKIRVQKEQEDEVYQAHFGFEEIEAFTLLDEDEILAVFGFRIDDKNEAECFALISYNIGRKLGEMVRFLVKKIPLLMRERGVFRTFMTVKSSFYQARRMAVLLGFEAVEKLPSFFYGNDYEIYERIEKW